MRDFNLHLRVKQGIKTAYLVGLECFFFVTND